jgi:hypothetical protein
MTLERWTCPRCGQLYRLDEPSCPICHVTRENRDVVGRIETRRAARAAPAPPRPPSAPASFPAVLREARFNLPLPDGSTVWTAGVLLVTDAGLFLLSEKDGADVDDFARKSPRSVMPVGTMSLFLPPSAVRRVVHERLAGHFVETQDAKIPLRLPAPAWEELDGFLDRLKIAHS